MKLLTKYQGEVEVENEQIIHFSNGIPGFPFEKEFLILPLPDNEIFFTLQSVNTPGLAFIVTNPFNFFKEYQFSLDEQTIEQLDINDVKDVQIMTILTVQDPFIKSTANLQGPIVINTKNKQSKQVILNNLSYHTKHPLFDENLEMVER
ncbi:flagellar assembly protein FliW [Heyndrickxia sporothermodurans]